MITKTSDTNNTDAIAVNKIREVALNQVGIPFKELLRIIPLSTFIIFIFKTRFYVGAN